MRSSQPILGMVAIAVSTLVIQGCATAPTAEREDTPAEQSVGVLKGFCLGSDEEIGAPAASRQPKPLIPLVTSISPVQGNATGGTSLTVAGEGFEAGAAVIVGRSSCVDV